MCGIAAILAMNQEFIPGDLVSGFDKKLTHRGPDASGVRKYLRDGEIYSSDNAEIVLIHRRLSIIDLDARSNQPMSSIDDRYVMVFNGEIYNYRELRTELEQLGHIFLTKSDSEVLLSAYAAWGVAALKRLVGMFAFIIFDRKEKEIFIARDPFGIKPLFWTLTNKFIAFASEIGPLLDVPGVGRKADYAEVCLYLSSGQTNGSVNTLFDSIKSFPAGSYAHIKVQRPDAPIPVKYWSPKVSSNQQSFDDSAKNLRDLFINSVRMHLRSDVPIGISLSGGIDSSSILSAARIISGDSQELHAFSFIAKGSEVDESTFIEMAANSNRAIRHNIYIEPSDIIDDIDRLINIQGEPFGSLSIYAQMRVMECAASHGIKVMLGGQGADELFAGYRPYLARRLTELLVSGKLKESIFFSEALLDHRVEGSKLIAQAFEPLLPSVMLAPLRKLIGRPFYPSWIRSEWISRQNFLFTGRKILSSKDALHSALLDSITTTVLPALLRYEDRNSMAVAVESRVPFLTTAMADFAYSLPSDYHIDNSAVSKSVFRSAMRGIVPDTILNRRDKIGFATPDQLWTKALVPWFEKLLNSDLTEQMPWLNRDRAIKVLNERLDYNQAFGFDMWRTINLIRWADIFNVKFS